MDRDPADDANYVEENERISNDRKVKVGEGIFSGCEIVEGDTIYDPYGLKPAKEQTKKFLIDAKNTFKTLVMNALAFIAAQAVQSFAQGIINTLYPNSESKGWGYVLSQFYYVLITLALAVLVGFLWNLGERTARKRWKLVCPSLLP